MDIARTVDVAAYMYPWDVLEDPAAGEWVAALGLDHVVLAAGYHATQALTPRHPRHRVVTAAYSAAYYPTSVSAWRGSDLWPAPPTWVPGTDSFGVTVDALAQVGVPVHAWLVLTHVDRPAGTVIRDCVVNAYGDWYPWALCPAQDNVVHYAATYAAEVAARPGISGVELEACGWYGYDHLGAHDKTAGVPLAVDAQYLLSLCFCGACWRAYESAGIDGGDLAARVRAALDHVFRGGVQMPAAEVLGADLAAAVDAVRGAIADRFRARVVAAVRQAAPGRTVALHADPHPAALGAFTGLDVRVAAGIVDRLVVNCWRGLDAVTAAVAAGGRGGEAAASDQPAPARPVSVVASLLAVTGLGGDLPGLPGRASEVVAAGADGVRLYHAGLASAADLAGITELTAHLRREAGRATTAAAGDVRAGDVTVGDATVGDVTVGGQA